MIMRGSFVKLTAVAAISLLAAACASTKPADTSGSGTTTTTTGPAPGSVAEFTQTVGDRVFFDYDRYDLDQQDRDVLGRQAAWLKQYPQTTLTIEGHCDERGTREYNLALGARRANAARDYLVSLGVDGARLATISYGKERPTCVESSEGCWSQNRRGVSVVTAGAAGM